MPQIDIPKIGTVTFDNFATEDTLRALLKAMGGSKTSADKFRKAEESARKTSIDSLGEFEDVIDLTTDTVKKGGRLLEQDFDQAGESAGRFIKKLGYGFEGLASGSSESGQALLKTTELTTNAISKTADLVQNSLGNIGGPVTQAIVGFFTGAAKLAADAVLAGMSFYITQMTQLRSQQRQFYDAGVFFANGIDDARVIATEAGISLDDLAKASESAKTSLRFMSGSSAGGIGSVGKVFKNFDAQQKKQLIAMGYTNDEVLEQIAMLGTSAGEVGKELSFEELQAQSFGYLENIKTLSKLTGEDIKAAKERKDAMRTDAVYQKALRDMGTDQATALKDFVANTEKFGPEFGRAAKRILTGQIPNAEVYKMRQLFPEAMAEVDRFRKGLVDGTVNQQSTVGAIARLAEAAGREGTKVSDTFAALGGLGSEYIDFALDIAGPFTATSETINKANTNITETFGPKGPLNDAVASFVATNTKLQSAINEAALSFTELMSPAVLKVSDSLVKLLEKMGASPEELAQIKKSQAQRTISQEFANLGAGAESKEFTGQDAIYDSIRRLSDKELADLGFERTSGYLGGIGSMDTTNRVKLKRISPSAQPINQALGGVIPHVNSDGTLVRAAEKQNEAFVPLPDGRSIPVKMDVSAFKDMGAKLDLLAGINRAMLDSMEENNRLVRQGNQLVS